MLHRAVGLCVPVPVSASGCSILKPQPLCALKLRSHPKPGVAVLGTHLSGSRAKMSLKTLDLHTLREGCYITVAVIVIVRIQVIVLKSKQQALPLRLEPVSQKIPDVCQGEAVF